mmetsp:Transcript_25725/g.60024  ORF Transcript_25725/g.60024 Transcript_25725/m.60024 type:complete len:277 (+) Transcript_25725:173-1003(+)
MPPSSRSRSPKRCSNTSEEPGEGALGAAVAPVPETSTSPVAEVWRLKLIHITKTAGSALEHWGKARGFRWGKHWPELCDRNRVLRAPQQNSLRCERYHTPPCFFEENPYKGFIPFTVVRDPYSRMISEFRCPWKGFQAPKAKPTQLRAAAEKQRNSATAADLNKWVKSKLRAGVAKSPFKSGHFIPQSLYICDEDGKQAVLADNILRYETLEADLDRLLKQHGWNEGPSSFEACRLNGSDMPPFSEKDLDAESLQLIEEAYRDDFDMLGYQRCKRQ